jgi:hypothetical protein
MLAPEVALRKIRPRAAFSQLSRLSLLHFPAQIEEFFDLFAVIDERPILGVMVGVEHGDDDAFSCGRHRGWRDRRRRQSRR